MAPRRFPDMEFFRQPKVHEQMCELLFLYSRLHPDLSYRQGMHELLATVMYVVHGEVIDGTGTDADTGADTNTGLLVLDILSSEHWIADTWSLFHALMKVSHRRR